MSRELDRLNLDEGDGLATPVTWEFCRDQPGFTMIEVLIAAAVVGISAIGLALMFGTGQAFITAEGDNRVAVYLAQQKMERCRALGFGSVLASATLPSTTTARIDPSKADLNPCVDTPTDTCDANTLVCYTRTTVIDCVSSDDYNYPPPADCTASPHPPLHIAVTVQASPSAGVVNPKTRPVALTSVLANR